VPRGRCCIALLTCLCCASLLGCEPAEPTANGGRDGVVAPQPPERLRVQVLETLPHDRNAFTQGFEIARGTLYEGTGRVGQSFVRAIDMTTGDELVRVKLPAPMFGEGLTVTESALWQITWQDGVAIKRHPSTLKEQQRVSYEGEGWGICHQPEQERLVMSDGSDTLTFRDPDSFAETGTVRVRSGNGEVDELNELECVGDVVYANVWQTDTILRIDPDEGRVTAEIDASGLLEPNERAQADVLNGIAAIPGSDAFFVTGKLWPKTFRVRFVPAN
jgi:glutamine cyclotransferase